MTQPDSEQIMYRNMGMKNPTDATVCRYLFTAKLLYMFRVSTANHHQEYQKLYPQPPVQVILLV